MTEIIILTLVCSITFTFEIVFGLAGTILMITIMTLLFDAKTLVIYSILPQLLTASIGLYRSPKTVNITFLMRMLAFGAIGGVAGLIMFYRFPTSVFYQILAIAITLFGLYLVASPHIIKINPVIQRMLDTLAGVSQTLIGISGPIAMTRLLGSFNDKLVIRNYALAFFLVMNLFRAGGYIINDTLTDDILEMMMISGPVLAIVLWNSNHLHVKVNEYVFRKVVSWVILIGGISLWIRSPY
ncbi:MAG: sulfite exporter TauE/SafE family protein [Gammaproteobacteria bacterium]|nr:sulfite exporter TauE/SafE family protein [Gammaproteobacteria bacterium]